MVLSSRAASVQAPSHARREAVVPVAYGAVVIDDDGAALPAGAVTALGVAAGTVEEELLEGRTDGAPPGVRSGLASGLASDDALGLELEGEEGVNEGVTGATVE